MGTPRRPRTSAAREPIVGPFTDYGQFGVDYIDTRVLWQTEVWVDRTGTPHALREMSPAYLTNVIGYLRGRAAEWHLVCLLDASADLTDAMAQEATDVTFEPAFEQLRDVLALDPERWIEDTPLMETLRRIRGNNSPRSPGGEHHA